MRARLLLVFLGGVLAGVVFQQQGLWRDRRRYPPPGRLVRVAPHALHVVCHGGGRPAVVFESAIAGSSLSWSAVLPQVARFTRACAYDRAGLGWSEASSMPRSFDTIVDDLAGVIAHIAPGRRCVLVGHSFGSFVVQAYAMRHPERVAGLVLVDPALEWLTMTPERARRLRGARVLARMGGWLARLGVVRLCLALLTGGAPGAPRRFVHVFGPTTARTLARLVGEVRKLPADVHPLVQAIWCQPKCFDAMADHLRVFADALGDMRRLGVAPQVPRVVISSADQPAEMVAAHARLASGHARSRHAVAQRGAHWVQFDQPELIVEAVRQLVEQERSQAPGSRLQ